MPKPDRTRTRVAHAKINLALAVGPPRAGDGLHPICSWFAPIDLADEVAVTRLPDGAPSRCAIAWAPDAPVPSPIDWPVERDLAARAHRALEVLCGRPLPVQVSVTKRIPVGGGLGGGSSDAGAALLTLRDLFELPLADADLAPIALRLGSDVPYFLLDPPTPAVVKGVGESVLPSRSLAGTDIVLVLPPFGTPTGAVYRAFDDHPAPPFRSGAVRALAAAGGVDPDALFNDLSGPAERVEPRLAELRRRGSEALGCAVHITGSGSTMFAVCPVGIEAGRLASVASAALPGCRALPARLL